MYIFEATNPVMRVMKRQLKISSSTIRNIAISSGAAEMVGRYGNAAAEFVKAYRGIDNETGVKLAKGLKGVSKSKVYIQSKKIAENNIKQQAGFSAEIQMTAQKNADNIISRRARRVTRTDDHPDFGKNHKICDHVELDARGVPISGSGSQMKFVGDTEKLLRNIAQGKGGGNNDNSRYLDVKLDLPSEQVKTAIEICNKKSKNLRQQAEKLETFGKSDIASEKINQANNYEKLRDNIRDSGITTEQAVFLRKHPELATAVNIAAISHRAGIQAAKAPLLTHAPMVNARTRCTEHRGEGALAAGGKIICSRQNRARRFPKSPGWRPWNTRSPAAQRNWRVRRRSESPPATAAGGA